MTSVHSKASDEMKELQESVASALLGFKSLQSYLAEPTMQVCVRVCVSVRVRVRSPSRFFFSQFVLMASPRSC